MLSSQSNEIRPNEVRRWVLVAITFSLFLVTFSAVRAEFVTDQLMVGMHSDSAPESTILKLLPSGTELRVMERDRGFAKVRDQEGNEGWIDAAYLLDRLRGAARRVELEAQLAGAAEQMRLLRATEQGLQDKAADTETQLIRQREVFAQREAELARDSLQQLEELQARFAEIEQADEKPGDVEAHAEELQQLKEENEYLSQQLTDARRPVTLPAPPPRVIRVSQPFVVTDINVWQWTLVGSALLLAFAIGAYMIDWDVRRRHGGFRV